MTEGEQYHIAVDPQGQGQDDWSVILTGTWDRVVGRFREVEIIEGGTKMNFKFEPQYVPEGINIECTEFDFYVGEVLASIIRDQHEKGTMQYYNKETGEKVDY
jgi:hypothetical protein